VTDGLDEQVGSVLKAMAAVVGFRSYVLARLDTEKGGLVLSVAPQGPGPTTKFQKAVDVLGFDPTGAVFPMWAEDAAFVRCHREGRLLVTDSLAELIGTALPDDVVGPIDELVGPKLYATVPVVSSTGTVLAVVLLERVETRPLTADERDRLLLYADRVGQLLEADRLGGTVLDHAEASPLARWLSVHLLDRELQPLWSGGGGPPLDAVVTALGGKVQPGIREVTLADGAAVVVHVNAVDPSGRVAWMLLCEDLAGRDRDVRDLREQLRLQLARVQEAVISVDSEMRITSCNDAARDVLGYEPAELIGQSVTACLPGGEVTATHKRLGDDVIEVGHADRQLRLQRRDGTTFPAEISVLLQYDESEEPNGALATVRDLTEQRRQAAERHRLHRKLLRSERLAALGEMAARIAHEVRNPLAAIGATALAIEEDTDAEEPARERAAAIGSEVRRLDTILTDLLQFAKPRKPSRQPIDLGDLARQALAVVRADPKAEEIEFEVRSHEGEDLRAPVDPDGMRQVIINLLRNAAEASTPGQRVVCEVAERGARVHIDVVDSGTGVTEEAQARAFEPFYSTKSRGTGLGLPISRRIVEEHDGRLSLRSGDSDGTTVSIELPVRERRRGAPRRKEGSSAE